MFDFDGEDFEGGTNLFFFRGGVPRSCVPWSFSVAICCSPESFNSVYLSRYMWRKNEYYKNKKWVVLRFFTILYEKDGI